MKKQYIIALLAVLGFVQAKAAVSADPKKNPLLQVDFKSFYEKLSDDFAVEKMDASGKGGSDIVSVFKKADAGKRNLATQLFDFNGDGKYDVAIHYQKGKKNRSEYDLDYDGKIDVINEFDPETGELAKKTMVDNNTLVSKYWFKNELRRKEVDRNGDGDVDMWIHYRNGKVVKTEVDVNFDGKNIRVEGDLIKNR